MSGKRSKATRVAARVERRPGAPQAASSPGPAPEQQLLRLQQTAGNQAVQRLLGERDSPPRPRAVPGELQRDFEGDFAGKVSTPAPATGAPAPGTVRVQTIAPQGGSPAWVNAPYGIYSPGEIPKEYHSQIMESTKSHQWRNPGANISNQVDAELARLANRGELTVRDMLRLSRGAGSAMNIRIAMAKVGSEFRFVGYDMSQGGPGGNVHNGFVESERGTTSGVGRALFADRLTRALLNRASGMSLEVFTSKRTSDFHAQIFATAGRQGAPTEGQKYQLNTTEMAKLVVAWNPKLSTAQLANLNALIARGPVAAADAENAILKGAPPVAPRGQGGGGGGIAPGATPIASPASTRSQAKGALLSWGAQALLSKQVSNMQSGEKSKALAKFEQLSGEIGALLDANFSVTITIEVEVPKTVNIAGVITGTDPSMIVYFRNMWIERAMKMLPNKKPDPKEPPAYHAMGEVSEKNSNPRRWEDPHEYNLDQQIRLQMGDPDPTRKNEARYPTHKVVKGQQTFTPKMVETLQTIKDNPEIAAPPPKPKMDEATAKKLAAAPTRVRMLSGNIVQYKKAYPIYEKLKSNPLFKVEGESMGGGQGLTRVIYWTPYDQPRAELLAEFLRSEGIAEARADRATNPDATPGYVQINLGRDAEKP